MTKNFKESLDKEMKNEKFRKEYNKELILERMKENKNKIFSSRDFSLFNAEDLLDELALEKEISLLGDNMYFYPEFSELIKEYVYPSVEEVAKKIAENNEWYIVPTGERALEILGLSTQVSNEYKYASDGPTKTYEYKGGEIQFIHSDLVDRRKSIEVNLLRQTSMVKEI